MPDAENETVLPWIAAVQQTLIHLLYPEIMQCALLLKFIAGRYTRCQLLAQVVLRLIDYLIHWQARLMQWDRFHTSGLISMLPLPMPASDMSHDVAIPTAIPVACGQVLSKGVSLQLELGEQHVRRL